MTLRANGFAGRTHGRAAQRIARFQDLLHGGGARGALIFASLFATSVADAAFTQRTCSSTVYGTSIPTDVGTRQFPTSSNSYPSPTYQNNTEYNWLLFANSNVRQFAHRIALPQWNTEFGWDQFSVTGQGEALTYQGTIPAGYPNILGVPIPWVMAGDAFTRWLSLHWHTDDSVYFDNVPYFDEVKPLCDASVNPTVNQWLIQSNTRYDGILIGTGDVIYLRVTQPANIQMTIVLDVLAADPVASDFDLYVSTSTATPDDSSYTFRGYRGNTTGTLGGGGESLKIPSSTTQRTLYIGVRSYSGAGHFTLHANRVLTSTRTVCETYGFGPSLEPYWSTYKTLFARTSMALAQATHGGRLITQWNVKTVSCGRTDNKCYLCDSSCDDCMAWGADSCQVAQTLDVTHTILPNWFCQIDVADPWRCFAEAHEYGHSLMGDLPDEYSGPWPDVGPFCGHSLMNGPGNSHILCTEKNHCKDPAFWGSGVRQPPAGFNCGASGTMWSRIAAGGKVPVGVGPFYMMTADPTKVSPDNATVLLPGNNASPLVTVTKIN